MGSPIKECENQVIDWESVDESFIESLSNSNVSIHQEEISTPHDKMDGWSSKAQQQPGGVYMCQLK